MSEQLAIDTNIENDQSSEQSTTPVLTLEEIKYALHQLFGAMFSRPILSQIPVAAILKIPEVVALSTDEVLIREILGENKNIIVTDEFIKSSIKPEQNTIILRDIPSSTPTEELIDIIKKSTQNDGSPCPPLQSIRSDTNDTWFVTFATESEARSALQAISNAKFNDDKIRARLKTESLVKYQSSGPNFIPSNNNNQPHIIYGNNNPNISINSNMSMPGGIYYNPVGNFPVVSPPNLMNAGPQWNVIPPPGYIPNPGTNLPASFMPMPPFIQQGPPKQQSPSHNRNYNKANNQRNRFNRNNSNNNLNNSSTPPPVQPVVVAIPQTGSPGRYTQNPPPNARQFNENGPSPDNYSPRSNSNNNVVVNENVPYYYRNQNVPIHPMNEYIDVGNGYVIPAYQVPIQLYQQHSLQQMQFHQFQIQQQAQAQAAHLMQQPVTHSIIIDNNRPVDSPRGLDSPRPNYIYFAGRTEPNSNSNPNSTTNKNNNTSSFKNDDNIEANAVNQAPAADNTTLPTQQQSSQLPTQSYRQKKDKSNYPYSGSHNNDVTQSKAPNNIGTNVTYTNTSEQLNANSTTGNTNNYIDKDKYRNNNRDSRRKPNNITNNSGSNNNASNRIRSDDRRVDKPFTKAAPKFNLESDFPTLIDGEAAPVSNPGNTTNDSNSGYAAALKRTVNVETKLDQSNNNAINSHISQSLYPLDNPIDEKNSVITASTDDDDLIVPPQYKQAWGLKKAANKINKKNSIDTVEPIQTLPTSNNNESNADGNEQGFLAFGSFNPVLPDTNVKTVYGATKTESTTVSPKSSNENKSSTDNKNSSATSSDNNQYDNSNSKRSFLDALKSKS